MSSFGLAFQSYLRRLQEHQMGTGSSTSSVSTITHTLIDFDFETGSMVPLTAASPIFTIWSSAARVSSLIQSNIMVNVPLCSSLCLFIWRLQVMTRIFSLLFNTTVIHRRVCFMLVCLMQFYSKYWININIIWIKNQKLEISKWTAHRTNWKAKQLNLSLCRHHGCFVYKNLWNAMFLILTVY